jgi:hypothetical protein
MVKNLRGKREVGGKNMNACKCCKLFDLCKKEYGTTIGGDYNMPPCASNAQKMKECLAEYVAGLLEEIRNLYTGEKK